MPEREFGALIAALTQNCPSEQREWLSKKLEYANELSLRQRMRQILQPFEELFGGTAERKQFIGKVIDTRYYLTHYDPMLAQRAVQGKRLWELCMKLEALFQLHFLRLIGLDGEFINGLANENNALRAKLET